jgi:hypothetical protein
MDERSQISTGLKPGFDRSTLWDFGGGSRNMIMVKATIIFDILR